MAAPPKVLQNRPGYRSQTDSWKNLHLKERVRVSTTMLVDGKVVKKANNYEMGSDLGKTF
jgi:hypothetical protein